MSGAQITVLVVVLLALVVVTTMVWIRRRRAGHVLIADAASTSRDSGRRS